MPAIVMALASHDWRNSDRIGDYHRRRATDVLRAKGTARVIVHPTERAAHPLHLPPQIDRPRVTAMDVVGSIIGICAVLIVVGVTLLVPW